MTLRFDHAIIAVQNLDTAMQDYRDLGFTVIRGDAHANRATQNALIVFQDGTYLELLAKTGETPLANLVDFGVLIQNSEGLVGFALRSDDIETDIARLKSNGFAVGGIISAERHRDDDTLVQWKLVLIEGGFAPFLIQDVTPRSWRIPDDPSITTHANRAVGLQGIEIVVREMATAWEQYTKLFGQSPEPRAANRRSIDGVILHEVSSWASSFEIPSFLRMFGGNIPQSEIDAASPATEPRTFEAMRKVEQDMLANITRQREQEEAMFALIEERPEGLFALQLVCEQSDNTLFTPERTHNVRFRYLTGTSPERGATILIGLNSIDWSAVHHAYGPATDVPDLLRALASDDKAVRHHAYEMMNNGNIIHQGTVYEASIETIPFLMQLLNAPDIQEKNQLLYLLEGIVFGGIFTEELRERTQTLLREALPHYLAQFNNPDPEVRRMIAQQLSLYESDVATLEPVLRTHIDSDADPSARAACIETLFRLWTGVEMNTMPRRKLQSEQTDYIAGLMHNSAQPLTVQYRAARVLVQDDANRWLDEALKLFYQMMENDHITLESLNPVWIGGIFYEVIDTLSAHLDKALGWILAQAKHPDAEVRQHIPTALSQLIEREQSVESMIPVLTALLHDSSPDVRQSATSFFYMKPYASTVIDVLQNMAASDPSLNIRVMAGNVLKNQIP